MTPNEKAERLLSECEKRGVTVGLDKSGNPYMRGKPPKALQEGLKKWRQPVIEVLRSRQTKLVTWLIWTDSEGIQHACEESDVPLLLQGWPYEPHAQQLDTAKRIQLPDGEVPDAWRLEQYEPRCDSPGADQAANEGDGQAASESGTEDVESETIGDVSDMRVENGE